MGSGRRVAVLEGAGGELLGWTSRRAQEQRSAAGLLQLEEIEARDLPPRVAVRAGGEEGGRALPRVKAHSTEPQDVVVRPGPSELVRAPPLGGAVGDVVLEVPLPRVRNEDEPMTRVAEPLLHPATHRSADQVAGDDRVAVVKDSRDGAGLAPKRACERGVEGIESARRSGFAGGHGVFDRDRAVRSRERVGVERLLRVRRRERVRDRGLVFGRAELLLADHDRPRRCRRRERALGILVCLTLPRRVGDLKRAERVGEVGEIREREDREHRRERNRGLVRCERLRENARRLSASTRATLGRNAPAARIARNRDARRPASR